MIRYERSSSCGLSRSSMRCRPPTSLPSASVILADWLLFLGDVARLRCVVGGGTIVAAWRLRGLCMRRGPGRRVASEVEAEQCDDETVYCAIDQATGNLGTSVRCRGTSDRFPRDCRAPSDGSIHKTCGGGREWLDRASGDHTSTSDCCLVLFDCVLPRGFQGR